MIPIVDMTQENEECKIYLSEYLSDISSVTLWHPELQVYEPSCGLLVISCFTQFSSHTFIPLISSSHSTTTGHQPIHLLQHPSSPVDSKQTYFFPQIVNPHICQLTNSANSPLAICLMYHFLPCILARETATFIIASQSIAISLPTSPQIYQGQDYLSETQVQSL